MWDAVKATARSTSEDTAHHKTNKGTELWYKAPVLTPDKTPLARARLPA
jgi:hypothetical protein